MANVNMNMNKVLTLGVCDAVVNGELVRNFAIKLVFVTDQAEANSIKSQYDVGAIFATWELSTIWKLKPDGTLATL